MKTGVSLPFQKVRLLSQISAASNPTREHQYISWLNLTGSVGNYLEGELHLALWTRDGEDKGLENGASSRDSHAFLFARNMGTWEGGGAGGGCR